MFERFLEEAMPKLAWAGYKQHPQEELLLAYVYEQLEGPLLHRLSAHIATCEPCTQAVRRLRGEQISLESQLAEFLSAKSPVTAREKVSVWQAVKAFFSSSTFVVWRPVYIHAVAYGAVAGLLVALNTFLDRLLITADPLGSPVEVTRWWAYGYWLLLPWGLLLIWHVLRLLKQRSK